MRMNTITVAATICVLSACGGGDVGSGGGLGGGPALLPAFPSASSGPISLSELISYANISTIDVSTMTPMLPAVATATYDGIVELERFLPGDQRDYVGRSTLNADFNAGTVSGTTTNFIEVAGADTPTPSIVRTISGSPQVTNGQINGAFWQADYNGNLTVGAENVPVNTTVNGGFVNLSGQDLAVGQVNDFNDPSGNTISGFITGNMR